MWDFGGVFTTSPFEAFSRFEASRNLPDGFLRQVNSTNPLNNAWARLESSQISREQFDEEFRNESLALGHAVNGADVLQLISGQLRPRMVSALKGCKRSYKVGCITNNMKPADESMVKGDKSMVSPSGQILPLFDTVVESCVEGVRKPDPRIYRIACDRLQVEPETCIFLDDLGVNLKPARAMGMTTIKVVDADEAIEELSQFTGISVPA